MGKEPLTVLHVDSESRWGGGQQQVAYLLDHLHRRGCQTALVCQPGSGIETFCRNERLPHFPLPIHSELDIISGLRLASICRRNTYRILHVHSARALSTGLWCKLVHPDVILIATRRVAYRIRQHAFSKLKYRTGLLNRIVCVSNHIKENLLQDGIPAEKCMTIHDGIDPHKFKKTRLEENSLRELGIPSHHLVVGTIAAMVGLKDYPTLLRAASIIIEQRPDVTFCALGDGPDRKAIHQQVRDLGLGNRFIFGGFQRDVGPFLKRFGIFVLASKWEGLGSSILEAQSVGLPVVATSTGGIPEVVAHNRNGLLVPPGQPAKLAEAILSLIDNEALRLQLGAAGLKGIHQFSIDKTVEAHILLYERIIDK